MREHPPSLTATVSANAIATVTIPTLANAGQVLRLRVWAWDEAGLPLEESIPFRLRVFPNSDRLGREQIAGFAGSIRVSSLLSPILLGNATLDVATPEQFDRGGLLRLSTADGETQEFGRVLSLTGGVVLDEAVAANYVSADLVSTVVELPVFPFWLTGGIAERTLYLEIENDHATESVRFGFEALILNQGHFEGGLG
jgi:hypothetical protein